MNAVGSVDGLALAAIELARPGALAWLVVPLVVAWLASRPRAPLVRPTGTAEIWREVARDPAAAPASRRAIPWRLALLLAALTAAVLALAEPRAAGPSERATWRVVVDRSPSMYLPIDGRGGATRLDRALELARSELERVGADARVEWIAASGEFSVASAGSAPPVEWSSTPRGAWDEPEWSLHDRAGTLWVTDRAVESRSASLVASGGAAAPGLVAGRPDGSWIWDGERVEEQRPRGDPIVVAWIDPELVDSPVGRAFVAWRQARKLAGPSPGPGTRLDVHAAGEGDAFEAEIGRDGWSARATVRAVPPSPTEPSRAWLSATNGDGHSVDVVRWSRGEIVVGLASLEDLRGDPAAFAVSWAELFDRAFAPLGVPAAERAEAGTPAVRPGAEPARAAGPPTVLVAALALAAAAFALGAVVAAPRSGR